MIGQVKITPSTPKAIITGRRPTRSDSSPNSGWTSMKTRSDSALIQAAASLLNPAVFTRNFSM